MQTGHKLKTFSGSIARREGDALLNVSRGTVQYVNLVTVNLLTKTSHMAMHILTHSIFTKT